jgi:hypothetical protein
LDDLCFRNDFNWGLVTTKMATHMSGSLSRLCFLAA